MLSNNPTEHLEKLKEESPKEKDVLTPDEAIALLNSMNENNGFQELIYKTFYSLNYGCGLRLSEVSGIKKTDIYYKNDRMYIDIQRSLQMTIGEDDLKSKSAERSLPLPVFSQVLVEKLLSVSPKKWEWLFQLEDNKPPANQKKYNEFIKSKAKSLGLPKITSHNMRHSIASYLMRNTKDDVALKKRMGHSKVEITKNMYGHLLGDADRELVEIIDNAYNSSATLCHTEKEKNGKRKSTKVQ